MSAYYRYKGSTYYKEAISDSNHRLFAEYMYDRQYHTPVCDIIYYDNRDWGKYNESYAYGLFYDLTPKPFNKALDIFHGYASKFGTFCKYEHRDLFTFRKRRRYDKRHYDDWVKDFKTLEEAMECFKQYFDEAVKNKNREVELSLIIHYNGYQHDMYGSCPHDFVVSVLRVDFSTVWEYYHNAGFQLECYFFPIFDAPVYEALRKEQTEYKNFAYQIFTDVRKLQGLNLNTEYWAF